MKHSVIIQGMVKKAKWYCDYNKHRLPKQERYTNIPKDEMGKKESTKEPETEICLKKSKKV